MTKLRQGDQIEVRSFADHKTVRWMGMVDRVDHKSHNPYHITWTGQERSCNYGDIVVDDIAQVTIDSLMEGGDVTIISAAPLLSINEGLFDL